MSEQKQKMMSPERACLTPRLQQSLDDNNLSQLNDNFIQLGYLSIDKICCLPQDQDQNFVEALNVNTNVEQFKTRTMLNEIRNNVQNREMNNLVNSIINTSNINNINNTNNNNNNSNIKSEPIDLTMSPEPIDLTIKSEEDTKTNDSDNISNNNNNENDMKQNIENENENEIISNQQKKYFLELLSEHGRKMNYNKDEKVIFFIPDNIPKQYIDRIGIIQSKISQMEYKIIDAKSEIPYNVPLELILNFNENNNNKSNKMINKNKNCKNVLNIQCGICYEQMQVVKAKNIYCNDTVPCDGMTCTKQIDPNEIMYHCNNTERHKYEYDLCCNCIKKNNKYKVILSAASKCTNVIKWNPWEEKFILECDEQYKNRHDMNQSSICMEISCKLSNYTNLRRKDKEQYAPWRTTLAISSHLFKLKSKQKNKNNKKRKQYESRSNNSPSKKRRTSSKNGKKM